MSGAAAVAAVAPAVPAAAEVVGYVEAATGTQILGWAWAPRAPEARLSVQALHHDTVLAEATADRVREDLARNGIGDGRHAFALDLPEAARAVAAELRVVARAADGTAVTLGAPPPAEATAERLDRLQRGVDTLIASQRLLHRNLQAALLARATPAEGETAAAEVAGLHADMARQLGVLEVFAMRLDERFAALTEASRPAPPRAARVTWVALLLTGVALALSVAGLLHAVPG